MHRIHIVGVGPRTGTTLLAEAMIACFAIDLYDDHETQIWSWPPRPGRIYLTKHPRDIIVAETVLKFFRNCHIVCLLRDPRDMIVSKHGRKPDQYWAGLSFWKTRAPIAHALEGHPRFMVVRYEDLAIHPDQVQTRLMRRMPFLEKTADFSRYHETSEASEKSVLALGSIRPISSANKGNWRRHKPRVVGQLQLHGSISNDLIEYGFEKDTRWERELDGIEPDLTPSFQSDDLQRARIRIKRRRRFRTVRALWLVFGHYQPVLPVTTRANKVLGRIARFPGRVRKSLYHRSKLVFQAARRLL